MSQTVFVHDNFVNLGGGTQVGEEIARCLPEADILTSVAVDRCLSADIRSRGVGTTWMQRLPFIKRLHRHYFPLYPFAMRGLDLSGYGCIVSSCYGIAKMVRKGRGALHICYCHSPTRWIWRFDSYVEKESFGPVMGRLLRWTIDRFKKADLKAAKDVDVFIANSENVAKRIRRCYGRDAHVIHPGIDVQRFTPSQTVGDFYLVVSRLVAYKRVDLAIEACEKLNRHLLVIGEGPHKVALAKIAGPNTQLLGWLPDNMVADLMSRCRAVILPGEEDFGLVPLEASASGRPCIAFAGGGALETIQPGLNGLFFHQPSAASLAESIMLSETVMWDTGKIAQHAQQFDLKFFQHRFQKLVGEIAVRHAAKERGVYASGDWADPQMGEPALADLV